MASLVARDPNKATTEVSKLDLEQVVVALVLSVVLKVVQVLAIWAATINSDRLLVTQLQEMHEEVLHRTFILTADSNWNIRRQVYINQ